LLAAAKLPVKKLCSRLSSSEVRFTQKTAVLHFGAPQWVGGGLGVTYNDHLRLIGKHIVDFLLVLTELFSLGVTAEALRANIGSKSAILLQRGLADPKFQVKVVAPTNHSSSHKTRLKDLSYGIKIWTDLSSILSQCTHLTDRRTDIFLVASPRWHSTQRRRKIRLQVYHIFQDQALLK